MNIRQYREWLIWSRKFRAQVDDLPGGRVVEPMGEWHGPHQQHVHRQSQQMPRAAWISIL